MAEPKHPKFTLSGTIDITSIKCAMLKEYVDSTRAGGWPGRPPLEDQTSDRARRPTLERNLTRRNCARGLTTGEIPFRKAYLGAIIDRVEVDDAQIRILGRKDVLEQAVLANGGPIPGVRSFVRNWRPVGDWKIKLEQLVATKYRLSPQKTTVLQSAKKCDNMCMYGQADLRVLPLFSHGCLSGLPASLYIRRHHPCCDRR